jgi:hypothetical protein
MREAGLRMASRGGMLAFVVPFSSWPRACRPHGASPDDDRPTKAGDEPMRFELPAQSENSSAARDRSSPNIRSSPNMRTY